MAEATSQANRLLAARVPEQIVGVLLAHKQVLQPQYLDLDALFATLNALFQELVARMFVKQ